MRGQVNPKGNQIGGIRWARRMLRLHEKGKSVFPPWLALAQFVVAQDVAKVLSGEKRL